jgi:hypothetical protein
MAVSLKTARIIAVPASVGTQRGFRRRKAERVSEYPWSSKDCIFRIDDANHDGIEETS